MILSLGQAGCSFHCEFCQNYHMLSPDIPQQDLPPDTAAALAADRNSFAIAYTYNEPWVGYEYVLDTARIAHKNGLKNVLVTNGYFMDEPFENMVPFIDAMNIDLKSMDENFYRTLTGGRLAPVKNAIESALRAGIHVELTTLLISGINDSERSMRDLVNYVASLSCGGVPLHLSRYHPAFRMNSPSTPVQTMRRAYDIACEKLDYVYLGNMSDPRGSDSLCPACGSLLVKRSGFSAAVEALDAGRCTECGRKVNFVM